MAKNILDVEPENLSGKECVEFSANPQLKKKYEDKWGQGITDVCGTDR